MRRAAALVLVTGVVACRDRGTAPRRDAAAPTALALTPALLDRVAALAVADATVRVLTRGDRDVALAVERRGVRADLTIAACLQCAPIDRAAWEAQRPALVALHAPSVDAVPAIAEARLDITTIDVGATRAIALDARRGVDAPARSLVHWNDGRVQIQAVCDVSALAAGEVNPCAAVTAAAVASALAAVGVGVGASAVKP